MKIKFIIIYSFFFFNLYSLFENLMNAYFKFCFSLFQFVMKFFIQLTVAHTIVLLPTKPSSDDDSGFKHGFGARSIITTSPKQLSHISQYYKTMLDCCNLWDCYVHTDENNILPCIFFMYFSLFDGGRLR